MKFEEIFVEKQCHDGKCSNCGKLTLADEKHLELEEGEVIDRVITLDITYSGHPGGEAVGEWCSWKCFVEDMQKQLNTLEEQCYNCAHAEHAEDEEPSCPLRAEILRNVGQLNSDLNTAEVEEFFGNSESPVAIIFVEDCPKFEPKSVR